MPIRKNPLTPRQTALRLLEHMETDASYGEIIRQMRILQDIDQTVNDVELVGFEGNDVVAEARSTALAPWEPLEKRSSNGLDSLLRRAAWRE